MCICTLAGRVLPADHPITQADSVSSLIGPVRARTPYPLLGEGGRAEGPDGCGAVRRTDLVPPLFRRCGGTFPQGKVRERPPGGSLPPRGR